MGGGRGERSHAGGHSGLRPHETRVRSAGSPPGSPKARGEVTSEGGDSDAAKTDSFKLEAAAPCTDAASGEDQVGYCIQAGQVSPLYELSRTRERSNLYRTASENRSLHVEPTDVCSSVRA
jgi:hypothetical protein